jgi:hypothetical protein
MKTYWLLETAEILWGISQTQKPAVRRTSEVLSVINCRIVGRSMVVASWWSATQIVCISLQKHCTPANAASHYFSLLLPLLPLPLLSLSSGLQSDLNLYEPVHRIVENVSYAVLILGELEDSQCLPTVHPGLPSALCEHSMLLLRKKLNGVESFFGSSWPLNCSRNSPSPFPRHLQNQKCYCQDLQCPGIWRRVLLYVSGRCPLDTLWKPQILFIKVGHWAVFLARCIQ